MFINPEKRLAPWVLALEQETYLSHIKKAIKRYCKLQTYLTSKVRLQNLLYNPQESHAKNLRCNNRQINNMSTN